MRCHAQAGFLAYGSLRRDRSPSRRTRPTRAFPVSSPVACCGWCSPNTVAGPRPILTAFPFHPCRAPERVCCPTWYNSKSTRSRAVAPRSTTPAWGRATTQKLWPQANAQLGAQPQPGVVRRRKSFGRRPMRSWEHDPSLGSCDDAKALAAGQCAAGCRTPKRSPVTSQANPSDSYASRLR
jgi:hypothetical protein